MQINASLIKYIKKLEVIQKGKFQYCRLVQHNKYINSEHGVWKRIKERERPGFDPSTLGVVVNLLTNKPTRPRRPFLSQVYL